MIGLALFLTFFIMWPTFQQINENAIQPLDNGDITIEEALKEAEVPIRQFMYGQVQRKDVKLFVDMLVTVMILTVLHWKRNMRNPGRVHMMRFR